MTSRFLLASSLLFSFSCAVTQKDIPWVSPSARQLYSSPEWVDSAPTSTSIKRIVIAGTSDFHGQLIADQEATRESDGSKFSIPVGGAGIIASYIRILRQRYGKDLLLLDAGDMYQGSLISNRFKGEAVVQLYNMLGYDAVTLGNHEFDFGPKSRDRIIPEKGEDPQGALKDNISKSKAIFLAANVIDIASGKPIRWKNTAPYTIKKINGVSVGLIGLATPQTPQTTIRANVKGLFFDDMVKSTLKAVKELRLQKVNVIVLVAHAGIEATKLHAPEKGIDFEQGLFDPMNTSFLDPQDEVVRLVEQLPPGTVDAVVSGHSHVKLNHVIHGVPVIQSFYMGKYIGRIELFFDTQTKKVVSEKTIIHAPTKFCQVFFKRTQDCFGKRPEDMHRETIPARFLGMDVKEDEAATTLLVPYQEKIKAFSETVLATLSSPLPHDKTLTESPLCLYTVDALRLYAHTPIAVTNSGGIRIGLPDGPITVDTLYKAMPFDNHVVTVTMTGDQLTRLVRIGTSGQKAGPYCFSGIKAVVSQSKDSDIASDLNRNGTKEDWERDRLVSLTLEDGSAILPNKLYDVATQDFLAISGGDNSGGAFDSIPEDRKHVDYMMTYRDTVMRRMQESTKKKESIPAKDMVMERIRLVR